MFKPIRLIPDNPNIHFLAIRTPALMASIAITLIAIVLIFAPGLNFGIDFKGGILIEARFEQTPDVANLRGEMEALGLGQIALQAVGTDGHDIMLRIPQQQDGDAGNQLAIQKVRDHFGSSVTEYRRIEMVGPQVGSELIKTSLLAVILSTAGILAYLWFRFDRAYSLATIAALMHDIIATLGFFAITQIDFDLSTVAAVLLISGYSLNDTVVVFDRIRENLRRYKSKTNLEVAHLSLNETLFRTMMTSGTTLLVLISLYLFGGEVIRSFTLALIVGIIVGTYSSIWLAVPVWLMLEKEKPKL
ncbi:MAG TPA: protein translocase subunit SecF [Alphaproteobacteria bacterium]|nr:protein translocase subunit SecF [Rhodospirillaceae bacterium]HRJ12743.1 protein translocase subunit SecF [Alphaproteobacteria bacterium]